MTKQLTFSAIDQKVKELDLSQVGVKNPAEAESEGFNLDVEPFATEKHIVVSDKFLKVYNVVRPILSLVSTFPFFPAKWRAVVGVFITAVDELVSQPDPELQLKH